MADINEYQKTLTTRIEERLNSMGLGLVDLEFITNRQKCLRITIEDLKSTASVTLDDCTNASHALDELLEAAPELEQIFKGAYQLEVSSPGINRPLKKRQDFERFTGSRVRIHLLRGLTPEEIGNPGYYSKNPKQKNFIGFISHVSGDKLCVNAADAKKPEPVMIPLDLISKAHLEPDLSFHHKKGAKP